MDTLRHHRLQYPAPPVYRYDGQRELSGPVAPPPGKPTTPVTLLIPEELVPDLLEQLAKFPRRHGAYLRTLLRRYRQRCIEGGVASSGSIKTRYQRQGQKQQRFSMRVDNEAWLELGAWADFLGVSRCLLFVMLVDLDLSGGVGEAFVGTPSNRLQGYDVQFPGYLEFRMRLYIFRGYQQRSLRLQPRPPDDLPNDLRLIAKYPHHFDAGGRRKY